MRVGYIRVSTIDQNTDRQLDGVAVDKVFTDKASGKDTSRAQLAAMLDFVREGDTVVVHSMDRLARDLNDLLTLVRGLVERGVRVEFVKEALTFTGEDSPIAHLMLSIMGAVAQFERAMIRERQREGIAKAKARGVYTGRKPALTPARAAELRARAAAGEPKTVLAKEFGISRDTVYTYLQEPGEHCPAIAASERTRAAAPLVANEPGEDGQPSVADPLRGGGGRPSEPSTQPRTETAPAEPPSPHPKSPPLAPSPQAIARARRKRWSAPGERLRDVVDIARDSEWGYHTVTDEYGHIGKVQRQITAGGGRGRWQAFDENNALVPMGPWNTVDQAVAGLLGNYLDRAQRRTHRKN
jgi:DNA invertase Pin-like site-specific DNA recombinase